MNWRLFILQSVLLLIVLCSNTQLLPAQKSDESPSQAKRTIVLRLADNKELCAELDLNQKPPNSDTNQTFGELARDRWDRGFAYLLACRATPGNGLMLFDFIQYYDGWEPSDPVPGTFLDLYASHQLPDVPHLSEPFTPDSLMPARLKPRPKIYSPEAKFPEGETYFFMLESPEDKACTLIGKQYGENQERVAFINRVLGANFHRKPREQAEAQFLLGQHYFRSGDYSRALRYFRHAVTQKENNPKAYVLSEVMLGKMYHEGLGVSKNHEEALEHLDVGARQERHLPNCAEPIDLMSRCLARCRIGQINHYGKITGARDYLAAFLNYSSVVAQYEKHLKKEIDEKAISIPAVAAAKMGLGMLYTQGLGVMRVDGEKGWQLLEEARSMGITTVNEKIDAFLKELNKPSGTPISQLVPFAFASDEAKQARATLDAAQTHSPQDAQDERDADTSWLKKQTKTRDSSH